MMENHSPYISFIAAVALERYRVVTLSAQAGEVTYATAGQTEKLFVTQNPAAQGAPVACLPLPNAPVGSFKLTADDAITLGARLSVTGAEGKVSVESDDEAPAIATALEAASADGAQFVCSALSGATPVHPTP